MKFLYWIMPIILSGCVYADADGRFAAIDAALPLQSHTTINKTVTVHAPPNTIVILQETPPRDYRCRPPICCERRIRRNGVTQTVGQRCD